MDYTILYVIGIVVVVLGLSLGLGYLRSKRLININIDDILFVVTMFNLSLEIVDELNLKQEPQIKKIGDILNMTMNYVAKNYDDNVNMQGVALDYALGLADKFGVEITEQRKDIIAKLIDIGLQTKI